MEKPIIQITPPDVVIKDMSGGRYDTLGVEVYDFNNSHLIYKGRDLGTFTQIRNNKKLAERVNRTIFRVKEMYSKGLIPEYIKNEIVNKLLGLEE